ncbi:MAG: D-ribose pyranase [Jatrophihabitans sp.]|uniref:D-ribose pyranase n=1 Tax=Jatrophihabitans sp. TaxID=1932789 RepID=UPI003911466D
MKRTGIVHAELARLIAGIRHTQTFVITDAGLPLPAEMPLVDVGYRYGQAPFTDVVATVLGEVVVEHSWVSRDIVAVNPATWQFLQEQGLSPEQLEHARFKALAAQASFAVRTGEATFYANVLCRAGVAFDSA